MHPSLYSLYQCRMLPRAADCFVFLPSAEFPKHSVVCLSKVASGLAGFVLGQRGSCSVSSSTCEILSPVL